MGNSIVQSGEGPSRDGLEEIWRWNSTVPPTIERCVHELIGMKAQSKPKSAAICAWDGEMTFGELDMISTRLAGHLVQLGVKAETLVPLCFEKSMWMVVAILSVLKAGGAFVPMDPDHPSSRHEEILGQIGASVILTSRQHSGLFGNSPDRQVVAIDRAFTSQLPQVVDTTFSLIVKPSNTAYIIFTSGSTGTPKGVVLEHQAVATSCLGHGREFNFTDHSRVLQFASYTFDACISEIITTLIFGGCVCVPSESDRRDDLAKVINTMEVNWIFITPSVARLIDPASVPLVRTVLIGGEQVSYTDWSRWSDIRGIQVINVYGPTECCVYCTGDTDDARDFKAGTIGRSVASVGWVVNPDDHNELVPLGEVGELVVEGPILARGYLNDTAKTAASFIEDPTWLLEGNGADRPGRRGRMYKTGDLVRYEPDGNLICLGRKDGQVKLRGQRVELGEIEHHLRQCLPTAKEVVAEVIKPDSYDGKSLLVAFVCVEEEQYAELHATTEGGKHTAQFTAMVQTVESHLRELLPTHMIPTLYIPIDEIPMTSSGKTDRKKLREFGSFFSTQQLAEMQGTCNGIKQEPETEMERKLQEIWARVLNIPADQIGLDDSLFRLGGDSISAMQVVALCRAEGITLSTKNIIKGKNIRGLAQVAKSSEVSAPIAEALEMEKPGVLFELSPIQQMYIRAFPRRDDLFDQCFYLRLKKPVSPSAMRYALEEVVQKHALLRARIKQQDDGSWRQIITDDVRGSIRWEHHRALNDNAMGKIIADSRRSLDFAEGPILAADLFSNDESQTFFITVNHLFVDLVSWRIILQDIEQLLITGNISPPTLPFQSWCQLQRNYAQKHLPPQKVLPFDIVPPMISYWGVEDHLNTWSDTVKQEFTLDAQTTASILGGCNDALRTEPVELFISGLIQSFSHVFQDRDIPTIFNEGHGREPWDDQLDLSRTVGWFTTLSPINGHTTSTGDMLDTIRRTKDCRRSLTNKGWGYFTSRFHNPEGIKALEMQSPVEILVNYQGLYQQFERQDTLFQRMDAPGEDDLEVSLQGGRFAVFVVSIAIEEGKAMVSFMYNRRVKHQDRVAQWIGGYKSMMTKIVAEFHDASRTYTLSDFPIAFNGYDGLDKFTRETLPSLGISDLGDVEDVYPCSAMQRAILIDRFHHPDHYWVRSAFAVSSAPGRPAVSVPRLQRTWQAVVERQAVLRTVFALDLPGVDGPAQIVLRNQIAGSRHIKVDRETTTAELFKAHEDVPIAERRGLEHYLTIYELLDGTVFCVLEISHTVVDGHSITVLYRDLSTAYSNPQLEAPPLYSEFISLIQRDDNSESLEYWKQYLHGLQPCLIPTRYAATGKIEGEDNACRTAVPLGDVAALREFCSRYELTSFNVIQIAWAMVLGMFSNTTSPCFGYLSSGRHLPIDRIDDMAGPTINMLTCRADISSSLGVLEALQKVQLESTESATHQACSLASVQHALKLGEHDLFNTTITYQRYDSKTVLQGDDIAVQRCYEHDPSEYDVVLHVDEYESAFEVACGYRTSRFSPFEAANLAATIGQAVQAIVANPTKKLGELELISKDGLEQVSKWNSAAPKPIERCLHDVVVEQARARPNAPAISAWDGNMSYSELDSLSTKLAGHLVQLGVKADEVVAVCFEKSMWTIVSMLSILKAGGAFLLLDPSLPAERLGMMCRKVHSTHALASATCLPVLAGLARLAQGTFVVSRQSISQLPQPKQQLPTVQPTSTAYVIFTSGSTGEPKGCRIEHQSSCSAILRHGSSMQLNPGSTRVLQFGSYSFAGCLVEMLFGLLHGSCICVPSEEDRRVNLARTMAKLSATWAFLTPTVLDTIDPESVPSLATLVIGGEPIRAAQIQQWASRVHLRQSYGSSETSGIVSSARLIGSSSTKDVGKADTGVYWIVDPTDPDSRLAPLGATGELLVEGPVLGRGYEDEPQKTAATFIQAPVWRQSLKKAHPRMYRTGDLARYKADGSIELLGRKDTQVKLRGQRIELGEIEHQAIQSDAAKELVVELIKPQGKGDMLACFFTLEAPEEMDNETSVAARIHAIRDRLERFLPQYMVPGLFVPLPQLPKTSSLKVDRKKLREMGSSFTTERLAELLSSQGPKRQPSTKAEETMQKLWACVLDVEESSVGLDDNFFRLGGDSMAAMKLIGEARKVGVQLSVADLFRHPVLEALAGLNVPSEKSVAKEIPAFSLLREGTDTASVRGEVAAMCNIKRSLVEDVYPCSPLQEGLMSLTSKNAGDYIMQSVLELAADVDEDAFRAAWEHVARSTPVLRTRIVQHSELGLVQAVVAEDINWLKAQSLETYLEKDKFASMGLGDQLTRYALVKEPRERRRWFVWTIHHALYDGWSLPRILHAVTQTYKGAELPPKRNFNAFVNYIIRQDQDAAKSYWQSALGDCEATLFPLLPSTIQQPVADTLVEYQCPPLVNSTSSATASTLIRAAWAIVASRYTNSDDVVFGTTVMGRHAPVAGIDTMLGPTFSTIPVRVRVRDQTVSTFLEELQDQAAEMIAYEQTGLQRIAKIGGPGAQHACGFQTLLVVQPAGESLNGSDNIFGEWHAHSELRDFTTYALMVQCELGADGVKVTASFDKQVIEEWVVKKMLGQLGYVMQQLADAGAKEKVADIDATTPADRQQLWGWNQNVPEAIDRCVHDLVAEQARIHPDTQAICAWDGAFTYAELNALSTKLAGHLVSLGVCPEAPFVPLCFEKSKWTTVAMLAVLKAGGAFVPLDPDHPASRHKEIFKQTGAVVVLASKQYTALCASPDRCVVPVSEASISRLPAVTDTNRSFATPNNAAYVIFTSGSTGTPKGVVLEHRAVSTSCTIHGEAFGFASDPPPRVLQFASYTFDACIAEIITTLLYGGCVCVPSESDRRNNMMTTVINDMSVDWVFTTPSVARLIEPSSVPSVKTLLIGGEHVSYADWSRWAPTVRTINVYGPTECCIFCTGCRNTQEFTPGMIGTSVASVSWVVDPNNHNRLAPLGSVGELLVEGPILARGYLNDSVKTAAAFIDDPAWLLEGGRSGRLYKTGDLVQYQADGNLVCMGRKDGQVKVRGQRVELGEIEHKLHACMSDVDLMAIEVIRPAGVEEKGKTTMAAFLQLDDVVHKTLLGGKKWDGDSSPAQVVFPVEADKKLSQQLPSYMVPEVYFAMAQLPMTTSGKIDRRRVREIGASFSAQQLAELRTQREGPKRQPTNKKERSLQQLWARVLDMEPQAIGLDDSFFRLGGDSIAVMKLVAEARKESIHLTSADTFRYPKLVDLAGNHSEEGEMQYGEEPASFSLLSSDSDRTIVLEEVAGTCGLDAELVEDIYPCSPLQEGLMSLTSKRSGDYTMQIVLTLRDNVNETAFQAAWEEVHRALPILRTRFLQHGEHGNLLQAVVTEDIQWVGSSNLTQYLAQDKSISMELAKPLTRYALVKEGEKRLFVWTMHHALYDGWSLPLVLNAVKSVYDGATLEKQPGFRNFIRYLTQMEKEAAAMYWQSALSSCEATLFPPLPSTIAQPVADASIEHQCPPLPATADSDITTSTLIRAAWAIVTSRHTSSDDVVFGTTVTGRNAPVPGIEAIIGPTIATVPVRVRLQGDQTVSALLNGLQEQAAEMIAHEQTGLQQIAKLGPGARHACSFQTLLVVQAARDMFDNQDTLGSWHTNSDVEAFTTYALMVQCTLAAEGVKITASFDSRVIERWVVEKMLGQFEFVMQQLAEAQAAPGKNLVDISITTHQDKQELWKWNQEMPPPVEKCIHDLFVEKARLQPDAPAIFAWDGGEMTYRELDALSSKLANHLVSRLGVKREDVVPLCFQKSMWTVVALLAVLKAGGAFLLLDPSLPSERLALMCRKARSKIVLASKACVSTAKALVQETMVVNRHAIEALPEPTQQLTATALPTSTAYVIYTSGSTGEPKGCRIEHRSSCSAIVHHGPSSKVDSTTRVLQFGSYSFAGCLVEMLHSLILGACICIPSEEERRASLASAISRMSANWAFLTPTVLDTLGGPEAVPSLKTLCIGGEPSRADQIQLWGSGKAHLRQTYGSSETAGVISSARLNSISSTPKDVGKASTAIYWIVDSNDCNRLAPLGGAGELLAEGQVLGRGYTDEVEKTAATFIQAPAWRRSFSDSHSFNEGQPRLYRTGDLARYKPDGSIELLGRKDTQVKLRGQRIELGEIEHQAWLSGAAQVKELAVELIKPGKEDILACFIAVERKQEDHTEEDDEATLAARMQAAVHAIRERLEQFLPRYMVPALFVPVPQLPTSTSQKVDRRRLRALGASFTMEQLAEMRKSSRSTERRQPSTDIERKMQQLWARVLHVDADSIGMDDSFFHLGGDSIAAMKLVGEARKVGLQLTVADLFHDPKLDALVRHHVRDAGESVAKPIPPFSLLSASEKAVIFPGEKAFNPTISMENIADVLPATFTQKSFIDQGIRARREAFHYFFFDLQVAIDVERLKHSCSQLLQHFPILRTHFVYFQEKLYQVVPRHVEVPFRSFSVKGPVAEESHTIHMRDLDRVTPLEFPTSFMLVQSATGASRLIIRLSHAQYDGVCLPVMLRTLASLYQQESLPPTLGFANYLSHIRERNSKSVEHWRQTLEGSQPTNIISQLDRGVPHNAAVHVIRAEKLIRTPRLPSGLTVGSLVSSAWAVVLSHITGSDDVVYGSVVAGRNASLPGITEMMGPCVNIVPVRVRPTPTATAAQLVHSVQDQFISLGEADSMGLDDIIKNCTSWPACSNFESVLQHQNIDEHPGFQFAGDTTSMQWLENPFLLLHQLMVVSYPKGDELNVTVSGNSEMMTDECAETLLHMLCKTIAQLASNTEGSVEACKASLPAWS